MKHKIPDTIASAQDLASLVLEIKDYAKWFEHESIKLHVNAKHVSKSPELSPSASELIHELGNQKAINQTNLDELIETLKEYSTSAPTITITLAAPATNEIKRNLVGWFRKNITSNVLVDFKFNATILGGMVVHAGSRIFDWSFRRQILANRNKIPEALHHV